MADQNQNQLLATVAEDEQFMSSEGFLAAESALDWDSLVSRGNSNNTQQSLTKWERESLYVKFDPLVGSHSRKDAGDRTSFVFKTPRPPGVPGILNKNLANVTDSTFNSSVSKISVASEDLLMDQNVTILEGETDDRERRDMEEITQRLGLIKVVDSPFKSRASTGASFAMNRVEDEFFSILEAETTDQGKKRDILASPNVSVAPEELDEDQSIQSVENLEAERIDPDEKQDLLTSSGVSGATEGFEDEYFSALEADDQEDRDILVSPKIYSAPNCEELLMEQNQTILEAEAEDQKHDDILASPKLYVATEELLEDQSVEILEADLADQEDKHDILTSPNVSAVSSVSTEELHEDQSVDVLEAETEVQKKCDILASLNASVAIEELPGDHSVNVLEAETEVQKKCDILASPNVSVATEELYEDQNVEPLEAEAADQEGNSNSDILDSACGVSVGTEEVDVEDEDFLILEAETEEQEKLDAEEIRQRELELIKVVDEYRLKQDEYKVALEEKEKVSRDRDIALNDLNSTEAGFAEMLMMYENAKACHAQVEKNCEILKAREELQVQALKKREVRDNAAYDAYMETMNGMKAEFEAKLKERESENLKLKAKLRMAEMKTQKLEAEIVQIDIGTEKLRLLCDDLLST